MSEDRLLRAVMDWQAGEGTRDEVVALFTALDRDQGPLVSLVIERLTADARQRGAPHGQSRGTDVWREELLHSRARTWGEAGLLVGPTVLMLTDGRRSVVLGERETRALSASVSATLMLLCQTIVLAQHALDAQDMQGLRQQRIESASTSMSEIEILP